MREPSPGQQRVLEFVVNFIKKHEYSPTLREIGNALGIASTNGVVCHLDSLETKGWVLRRGGKPQARSISLTAPTKKRYGVSMHLNVARVVRRLEDLTGDFPGNLGAALEKCITPEDGASLVIDVVNDILVEEC